MDSDAWTVGLGWNRAMKMNHWFFIFKVGKASLETLVSDFLCHYHVNVKLILKLVG